jgi:hypothetical protein
MIISEALTPAEIGRLDELEYRVQKGIQTFLEVGVALAEIRDRKLYRATHDTFEDYVSARWAMSRSYAHRTIAAAEVVTMLPMGNIQPTSERQVRPLLKVPPEDRAAAWERAQAIATDTGQPVTTAVVEQAVGEIAPNTNIVKPRDALDEYETARPRWGPGSRDAKATPQSCVVRCLDSLENTIEAMEYLVSGDSCRGKLPTEYHAATAARLVQIRTRLSRLIRRVEELGT